MLLVLYLLYLHEKQMLVKLLFENQQNYANPMLGLMLDNFTSTRGVNPCRPLFIRVEMSIQRPVDSHFDKTRPAALKIWSCLIFNEQDQK